MIKAHKRIFLVLLLLLAIGLGLTWLVRGHAIPVLQPQGVIASQQRDLLVIATVLGLGVVLPVLVMTFLIVWRYHEHHGSKKAKYSPEWDHNVALESLWWGVPCLIIIGLSVITWHSSHALDPFKPLVSTTPPLTIQVVALPWKWLFIYPEQGIATVNYVQFPERTPINFELTADAPMNSFWIPSLGGQVYAMAGMSTRLHLMADASGSYRGSSANLSGEGFAGMSFTARSTSAKDFKQWAASITPSANHLSRAEYDRLARPSKNNPISYYSSPAHDLYATVMMKYMGHEMQSPAGHN